MHTSECMHDGRARTERAGADARGAGPLAGAAPPIPATSRATRCRHIPLYLPLTHICFSYHNNKISILYLKSVCTYIETEINFYCLYENSFKLLKSFLLMN